MIEKFNYNVMSVIVKSLSILPSCYGEARLLEFKLS